MIQALSASGIEVLILIQITLNGLPICVRELLAPSSIAIGVGVMRAITRDIKIRATRPEHSKERIPTGQPAHIIRSVTHHMLIVLDTDSATTAKKQTAELPPELRQSSGVGKSIRLG